MAKTTLKRVHGYLAQFESAGDIYHAAEKIAEAGYQRWDCHSPFPIHGLNKAMRLKRSFLPWLVFGGGATGFGTAFFLAYITQCLMYRTVVQSKPANIYTTPAFFPIMFELTILLASFTSLFGGLALMGLPRWNHPLFAAKRFPQFSDDGFFICIEARDPQFHQAETKTFLQGIGGQNVELIEDEL